MKADVAVFTDTDPANFCDVVVGSSSFDNLPFDVMGNVVPDVHICTLKSLGGFKERITTHTFVKHY